jgi:ornithine cyclodeaminase/alanine dehydrogenase-like protein (mu-crystallin family)
MGSGPELKVTKLFLFPEPAGSVTFTIFDSTGTAILDVVAAVLIYKRARGL